MHVLNYSDAVKQPLPLRKVFPGLDNLRKPRVLQDAHTDIRNVLTDLHSTADGKSGFQNIFEQAGNEAFEFGCHQCSYAFALLLSLRGFKCTLLDCFEIENPEKNSWRIVKTVPEARFVEAGTDYNPHCLVAVGINNMEYLVSAKHFAIVNGSLVSLLSADSHASHTVGEAHPQSRAKSGIYIGRVFNEELQQNYPAWDYVRFPIWLKSDGHSARYYKVFQRTPLTL